MTQSQWKHFSNQQRDAHVDQLRHWLEHLYVQTSELTAIGNAMTKVVRSNSESPPGSKDVVVLTGPNAVGKSTLMMRWGRDRYLEWTRTADHDGRGRPVVYPSLDCEADMCPVVWINLDASTKIKDFDVEILEFFGLPGEGLMRHLSKRAVRATERHQTRILIVDDAHLLKTNWKGGRDVLDHIKHINTELGEIGITLILIGANLAGSDLVTDPQIAGRLKMQTFPRYELNDIGDMRAWQGIVRQLENQVLPHLPAGKPGMLFTKLPSDLWFRTQGYLGDLTELIAGATLAATSDNAHEILLKHLDGVELSERAEEGRHHRRSSNSRPRPA
ncbi:ATP-binding protein [Mycobacterium sp. AT1]|uniref:ATP-binding protein n=1 Tax=Mycobacterium sp. AT1 TaxID=1961706 RepID=UPI001E4C9B3B|nr:ATP-binding protein [Mycobacterium sp. AT1]